MFWKQTLRQNWRFKVFIGVNSYIPKSWRQERAEAGVGLKCRPPGASPAPPGALGLVLPVAVSHVGQKRLDIHAPTSLYLYGICSESKTWGQVAFCSCSSPQIEGETAGCQGLSRREICVIHLCVYSTVFKSISGTSNQERPRRGSRKTRVPRPGPPLPG